MEHVTIVPIGDNNVKMIPDKGYKIANYNGNTFSVVICSKSDIKNFKVVAMQ